MKNAKLFLVCEGTDRQMIIHTIKRNRKNALKYLVDNYTDGRRIDETTVQELKKYQSDKKKGLCTFSIGWVGQCKEPGFPFCDRHQFMKCSCGKHAVRDCEATLGAFTCGRYLCENCRCNH